MFFVKSFFEKVKRLHSRFAMVDFQIFTRIVTLSPKNNIKAKRYVFSCFFAEKWLTKDQFYNKILTNLHKHVWTNLVILSKPCHSVQAMSFWAKRRIFLFSYFYHISYIKVEYSAQTCYAIAIKNLAKKARFLIAELRIQDSEPRILHLISLFWILSSESWFLAAMPQYVITIESATHEEGGHNI